MLNSNEKIIKHKVGLLNLAEELGNLSQACKIMGLSRETFFRYKEAVNDGGVKALLDANRRIPNLKNRVDEPGVIIPRIIHQKDAPKYLGMNKQLFNDVVRPYMTVIKIGDRGIGYCRYELDYWIDNYMNNDNNIIGNKHSCSSKINGEISWERKTYTPDFSKEKSRHIDKQFNGRRICRSWSKDTTH